MMFQSIIKKFEDKIDLDEYFNSLAFENVKNKILNDIKHYHLIFLIGEPGSGKTYMLKYIQTILNFEIIYFERPFETKQEFFDKFNVKNEEELKQKYKHTPHLIIIDEAQMLDIKYIEFIRTLSDTKMLNFILSFHLREAEIIMNKSHFKNRDIDIIKIGTLQKEEMIRYIQEILVNTGFDTEFNENFYNKIYKYTKGNFRMIKKFMKTLFYLQEIANTYSIKGHEKINSCLIDMTAIKIGIKNG